MGHQNQTNQLNQLNQLNQWKPPASQSPSDPVSSRANPGPKRDDSNESQDVAVFFDFENIVYSTRNCLNLNPDFGVLMDCFRSFGRVVIARAYAVWRRHAPTVSSIFHGQVFDPIFVPSYQYGRPGANNGSIKNSVDMHLCVDAMRVLYRYPHLNAFVLISGDRDFIPLVRALRMEGKMVIGVGVTDTTSTYLGRAVDHFVFYQDLLARAGEQPRPAPRLDGDPAPVMTAEPAAPSLPTNGTGRAPAPIMPTPILTPGDDGLWSSLLYEAEDNP